MAATGAGRDDDVVEVRIAAFGIGEQLTVSVPARWAPRVRALEAVTCYGPGYQRRVVDTLADVTHQVRSGQLNLAEAGLSYCESVARS